MKKIEPVKRVLHIVSSMDRGGTETLLMNVYRNIDKSKIQFDFISHGKKMNDYEEEISSLGGKLFKIDSLGTVGLFNYWKELRKIFLSEAYIAVHSHTDYQSGIGTLVAKFTGIPLRICHSHSTNWPRNKNIKTTLILKLLKAVIKLSATNYCACSLDAAYFLFNSKDVNQGKVCILKNGIEIDKFKTTELNSKNMIKDELGIPTEAKIIGNIGRFSESKNQIFILKILKEMVEKDHKIYAILVGDGPLRKQIESNARELGIFDYVRFLGVRDDIPDLINTFDVFVFPSFYEGFGIVALEAQCAGVPCIASEGVPKTTDMGLNLIKYISLEEDITHWITAINKAFLISKPNELYIQEMVRKKGFSIQENLGQWLALYGAS